MKENLPDKTVIIIILSTLLFIFSLIFTFLPARRDLQHDLEWRDSTQTVNLQKTNL